MSLLLLTLTTLLVLAVAKTRAQGFAALLDDYSRVTDIQEVALSPDAALVAWIQSTRTQTNGPSSRTALYVADWRHPSSSRRIAPPEPKCTVSDLAWSPDGRSLAFLSDCEEAGQLQAYIADISSGARLQLTHLHGSLAKPSWSPNGKVLAMLLTENTMGAQGPTTPKASPLGVVEERIPEQRNHYD